MLMTPRRVGSLAALLLLGCQSNNPEAPSETPTQAILPDAVSDATALAAASAFLATKAKRERASLVVDSVHPWAVDDGANRFVTSYAINFASGGFVIVAARSSFAPIIGYSTSGRVEPEGANPGFDTYMRQINLAIRANAPASPDEDNHADWEALLHADPQPNALVPPVGPLLATAWHQHEPYNARTPREVEVDPEQPGEVVAEHATPVGCGAVALAQVLRYHQYPPHGAGYNAYTWKSGTASEQLLRAEFVRLENQFDLMPTSLTAGASATEVEETTEFLREVGIAVDTDYGRWVSTAATIHVVDALIHHYRYSDALQAVQRSSYAHNDRGWIELLKGDIVEGRPVLYRAETSIPGSGHMFVVDGVDAEDNFHINWGSGGGSDGWFTMVGGPASYTLGNQAIVGIRPYALPEGYLCGGWGGWPCAEGLFCKNRVNGVGTCQQEGWCYQDTVAADCDGQPHDAVPGRWVCQAHSCVWTPGSSQPAPVCNDGVQEGPELCDGTVLDCRQLDASFSGGEAPCKDSCTGFDISACTLPACGDGIVDPAEQCENGSSVSCAQLGSALGASWSTGIATCLTDSCHWTTWNCRAFTCGDGVVDATAEGVREVCDGDTIACQELDPEAFLGGIATCSTTCESWDTSACELRAQCGNGIVEDGEVCDANSMACAMLDPGHWGIGTAQCRATCNGWVTAECQVASTCGNGVVEGNETCDGSGIDCAALNPLYYPGTPAPCSDACNAYRKEPCGYCGDGLLNGPEVCDGAAIACVDLDDAYVSGTAACTSGCDGWLEDDCETTSSAHEVTMTEAGKVSRRAWVHFGPFPSTQGLFEAVMTGTGDADLYVKRGSRPTSTSYDCRPYGGDSNETCKLSGPGDFYVSVSGYASSSSFSLAVTYTTGGTTPALVPQSDHESGVVQGGEWTHRGPYLAGLGAVSVVMTGTGDADLYVAEGAAPTSSSFDCRPWAWSSDETCDLQGPGMFYVSIYGYANGSSAYDVTIDYMGE